MSTLIVSNTFTNFVNPSTASSVTVGTVSFANTINISSGASDGYVLTSNSNGDAYWAPSVGGSGTSGTSGVNGAAGATGPQGPAGVGATYGIWGIANSDGSYNYYNTLTLAMNGATAGQTIEMFSDVTETGNVTVTLKNGVNINGNGHTYTYTNNSGNCFVGGNQTSLIGQEGSPSNSVNISNLKIIRTNTAPTGGLIFYFDSVNFSSFSLFCKNVNVYYNYTVTQGQTPIVANSSKVRFYIDGLFASSNGSGVMFNTNSESGLSSAGSYNNCTIINTSTQQYTTFGADISTYSTINNCDISVNQAVGVIARGKITNSKISSMFYIAAISGTSTTPSFGWINPTTVEGTFTNCYLYSKTSLVSGEIICNNCTLISDSGTCARGSHIYNSYCYTETGNAVISNSVQPKIYNSTVISNEASAVESNLGVYIVNSNIVSNYNEEFILISFEYDGTPYFFSAPRLTDEYGNISDLNGRRRYRIDQDNWIIDIYWTGTEWWLQAQKFSTGVDAIYVNSTDSQFPPLVNSSWVYDYGAQLDFLSTSIPFVGACAVSVGATSSVISSHLEVSNAFANCLRGITGSVNINYINNAFTGTIVPVNQASFGVIQLAGTQSGLNWVNDDKGNLLL